VNEENKEEVLAEARRLVKRLSKKFRTRLDDRDQLTPGKKFNEWELKGVPLRIELGPRDIKAGRAVLVRRDTGVKRTARLGSIVREAGKELDAMQRHLLDKARDFMLRSTREGETMDQLKKLIEEKRGVVRARWCGRNSCEDRMKDEAGGKIINVPLDQGEVRGKCVACGEKAQAVVNFAKSY
jgi:prolyl-tRNA synthetase